MRHSSYFASTWQLFAAIRFQKCPPPIGDIQNCPPPIGDIQNCPLPLGDMCSVAMDVRYAASVEDNTSDAVREFLPSCIITMVCTFSWKYNHQPAHLPDSFMHLFAHSVASPSCASIAMLGRKIPLTGVFLTPPLPHKVEGGTHHHLSKQRVV